ncbi:MAG: thiamine-phosphate kinase [Deltaproteobacteria bacterium]|nr:thiamine-phosphate kinase [Deltaproteobacteria bacterium]
MRLEELGEASLIRRLKKRFSRANPRILRAIGDDTAVTLIDKKRCLLTTTDTLVERIHFNPDYAPPYHLGRKVVSISLSDIAAMGGSPLFFLVSAAMPPRTTLEFFDEFYKGIEDCAGEFGVSLIGGNTSSSKEIVVTGTMLGEALKGEVIYRSGAGKGDAVYLTGTAGDSALGLKVLKERGISAAKKGPFKDAVMRHLNPKARVRAGMTIARKKLATSMIDVSDGVLADLRHICEESKTGARVEFGRLPLSDDVRGHLKENPADFEFVLAGGEDYELLFTAAPGKEREISAAAKGLGLRITRIGEILPRRSGISVAGEGGAKVRIKKEGYEHFR